MKPFITIKHLLRPDLTARIAQLSIVLPRGISSLVRCQSTFDSPRPLPNVGSAETADAADTADSSQHVSAIATTADSQGPAKGSRWTPEEWRTLRDVYAAGMTAKAIASYIFPTRTIRAVMAKLGAIRSNDQPHFEARGRSAVPWSQDDKKSLLKLYADGASLKEMRVHFPIRSRCAIHSAIFRHATETSVPVKKSAWSDKDVQAMIGFSEQGMSTRECANALGRTVSAVEKRAAILGISLRSRSRPIVTAEEMQKIIQMRSEKFTHRSIAASIGRPMKTVENISRRLMPPSDLDVRLHPAQLARIPLDVLRNTSFPHTQHIPGPSMQSWSPEHALSMMKEGHRSVVRRWLSPTELREVEHLREEGRSWGFIVNTKSFRQKTADGLRKAYHRALAEQKSQT